MSERNRDFANLLTEQNLEASIDIDEKSTLEILATINQQDQQAPRVVGQAAPAIAALVDDLALRFGAGGRLVYFGAGTSGRLGVLDASECPPTFHCDPDEVVGLIAGGDAALRVSSEGMEDDPGGAAADFERLGLGVNDMAVGIAASGSTPYVIGGLSLARQRGAGTGLIRCAPGALSVDVDHVITLPVGPEVVAGSTRMKAGTATKLALNMITTSLMIRLGKTWGNLMVDLKATNEKLMSRAIRMLMDYCGVDQARARSLIDKASGKVKLAIVMARRNVGLEEAERILARNGPFLSRSVGPPGAKRAPSP